MTAAHAVTNHERHEASRRLSAAGRYLEATDAEVTDVSIEAIERMCQQALAFLRGQAS